MNDHTKTAAGGRTADEIRQWLIRKVSTTAGIAEQQVDMKTPLAEYGLNSRQAVGLAGDLEEWMGRTLEPTLVWDYPTVQQLTDFLSALPASDPATKPAG